MPTLVVQMGHSGRTSGATGAPGEMAFTEAVGAACLQLLDGRSGWSVRAIPADPPAAAYRGTAFVAVHADGSVDPRVRGASVGHQNQVGRSLAHAWRDHYVRLGFTGPWHPDNYTANLARYYGVGQAIAQGNAAACIVECGTITNAEDRALMSPTRVALAIGDALGIEHGRNEEDDVATPEENASAVWWRKVPDRATEGAPDLEAFQALASARADSWNALQAALRAEQKVDRVLEILDERLP